MGEITVAAKPFADAKALGKKAFGKSSLLLMQKPWEKRPSAKAAFC